MRNAAAVLRHLRAVGNSPQTMTAIASSLGLNQSTCFDLLKVLADEGLLAYNDANRPYRLGPALIDFAAVIDDHGDINRVSMEHVRRLARELQLTVVLMRLTGTGEFVVLGTEDSPKPFRVTLSVGERFLSNSAVLAKAYLAWHEERAIDDFLERKGLVQRTATTITDREQFKRDLRRMRERGYATSVGEFYRNKNTVAAPVFDRYNQVNHVLLVVALEEDLLPENMEACGGRVREAAMKVTAQIGGVFPLSEESRRVTEDATDCGSNRS